MSPEFDVDVLKLVQFMGRHAQLAYQRYGDVRRALLDYDAIGMFQRDQGYVAGSNEHVIVSFAGTRSPDTPLGLSDWCDNLSARLDAHPGGHVHAGTYHQIREHLREEMCRGFEKLYYDQPILLTGHSRGGALALLAAHELLQMNYTSLAVFTFGSPKVGDRAFVDSCRFPVYRIECEGDPVPLLPPLKGYAAAGEGLWLADNGTIHPQKGVLQDVILKGLSWGERIVQMIRNKSLSPEMLEHHRIDFYLERLAHGRLLT